METLWEYLKLSIHPPFLKERFNPASDTMPQPQPASLLTMGGVFGYVLTGTLDNTQYMAMAQQLFLKAKATKGYSASESTCVVVVQLFKWLENLTIFRLVWCKEDRNKIDQSFLPESFLIIFLCARGWNQNTRPTKHWHPELGWTIMMK